MLPRPLLLRYIEYRSDLTIRIWPILLLGFGALIALVGLSGWLAYQRAKSTYSGVSELYETEHKTQESLTQIRYDIDTSAILLRDLLLDQKISVGSAKAELARLRASTQNQLALLDQFVPKSQVDRLAKLRTQTTDYWRSVSPVLTETPPRLGLPAEISLLQTQIFPHRQAALHVVAEVGKLSFEAFQAREKEIDARDAGLAVYLGKTIGITLLIALGVAGVSVLRMYSLERTADMQHRHVQQAETGLRKLSQQLVRAQEEERRSLSRDLHDQVGQVLTALRMSLGNLEKALAPYEGSTLSELELSKRLVGQALRSTRDLAMGLRPTMLDDLGLESALEWYARQHAKLYGIPVSVHVDAALGDLSDAQKTCVYRIVQEALNNSAKYAQAENVTVTLGVNGEDLTLEITDDGIGFDPCGNAGRGLGLLGMRERVAQLGGSLTIESSPRQGTRIRAELPRVQVNA